MKTVLDCGHVDDVERRCPRNNYTEVLTLPDGGVFYDFDYPKRRPFYYCNSTRRFSRWEKWDVPRALNEGAKLTRICHVCAAVVHLDLIKSRGKGMFFVMKCKAEKPYRDGTWKIEHGRTGKIISKSVRWIERGHNWWRVHQYYVWFPWDGSLWLGRNVCGQQGWNDCLYVKRLRLNEDGQMPVTFPDVPPLPAQLEFPFNIKPRKKKAA